MDGALSDGVTKVDGFMIYRFFLAGGLFIGGLFLAFGNPDNGRGSLSTDQYVGFSLCGLGLFIWWGIFAFPSIWARWFP